MRSFALTLQSQGCNLNDSSNQNSDPDSEEEALREVVDVKCGNCGKFLPFTEVNEHSAKCTNSKGTASANHQKLLLQRQSIERELREVNENILQIQEAIVSRLA